VYRRQRQMCIRDRYMTPIIAPYISSNNVVKLDN
jgi:hypothetical protein